MAPHHALRAPLLALLSLPAAAQTIWFVDVAATPPGDGSYATPYTSIQYAIDQPTTVSGDRIHIFSGVYFERLDLEGKSLTLWGLGSTIIDGSMGPPPQPGVAGSTITIASGEVAILNDLVIRGGAGSHYPFGGPSGGGLFIDGASVTLNNCTITDNEATDLGGGIYVRSGSIELTGCSIRQNSPNPFYSSSTSQYGGGLAIEHAASAVLIACDVSDNSSQWQGGGIHSQGFLQIEFCTIRNNYTSYDGGGILDQGSTSVSFSSFSGNSTSIDGGGAAIFGSPLIEDCLFVGNSSPRGGAIQGYPLVKRSTFRGNIGTTGGACRDGGYFEDCLFEQNVASNDGSYFGRGGAVHGTMQLRRCVLRNNRTSYWPSDTYGYGGAAHGGATLIECVLYGNVAGWGGAVSGVTLERCTLYDNLTTEGVGSVEHSTLVDCIVWDNHPQSLESSTATYSDIQGGWAGVGNIDADPMFWDAAAGDFQLKPGSPCIDAGDPAGAPDPDGSVADMGALPFDAGHCAEPAVFCTPKVNLLGCAPGMGYSGTPSLGGADDFVLRASDLTSQQAGILIWSQAASALPFYGGTLCVQPPVIRAGVQGSGGNAQQFDCSGSFAFHFSQAYMAQHLLGVGATLHAQFWMRDVADPLHLHVGLTDGLRFSVCP